MVSVTKPYLPNCERPGRYQDAIYDSHRFINRGQPVQKFICSQEEYLDRKNLLLAFNAIITPQIAGLAVVNNLESDHPSSLPLGPSSAFESRGRDAPGPDST